MGLSKSKFTESQIKAEGRKAKALEEVEEYLNRGVVRYVREYHSLLNIIEALDKLLPPEIGFYSICGSIHVQSTSKGTMDTIAKEFDAKSEIIASPEEDGFFYIVRVGNAPVRIFSDTVKGDPTQLELPLL